MPLRASVWCRQAGRQAGACVVHGASCVWSSPAQRPSSVQRPLAAAMAGMFTLVLSASAELRTPSPVSFQLDLLRRKEGGAGEGQGCRMREQALQRKDAHAAPVARLHEAPHLSASCNCSPKCGPQASDPTHEHSVTWLRTGHGMGSCP